MWIEYLLPGGAFQDYTSLMYTTNIEGMSGGGAVSYLDKKKHGWVDGVGYKEIQYLGACKECVQKAIVNYIYNIDPQLLYYMGTITGVNIKGYEGKDMTNLNFMSKNVTELKNKLEEHGFFKNDEGTLWQKITVGEPHGESDLNYRERQLFNSLQVNINSRTGEVQADVDFGNPAYFGPGTVLHGLQAFYNWAFRTDNTYGCNF